MSAILESALSAQQRADCAIHDASLTAADRAVLAADVKMTAAANAPQLRAFWVEIKSGKSVIMAFEAMGQDSVTVAHQHGGLCGPGQYVSAKPRASEALIDARLVPQPAVLNATTDAWHARNDARALAAQVMDLDAMRRAGW